jgi:hypothetical protein
MSTVSDVFGGLRTALLWIVSTSIKAETSEAIEVDGRSGLVLPVDRKFEDLTDKIAQREQYLYDLEEKRAKGPRRIEAVEEAQTLAGFCALVNRHKGATTKIDAELDAELDAAGNPRFVAKIDYHGASDGVSGPDPRWCKHKVVYSFPFSRQFKAWLAAGEWMDKKSFLDFADKHYVDIADPAEITKVGTITEYYFRKVMATRKGWDSEQRKSATLSAVFGTASELIAGARAASGTTQEVLEEKIDEEGNVEISYKKSDAVVNAKMNRHYLVDLRVFEGDEELRVIPARLFTEVERANLKLRLQVEGVDRVVEAAFEDAQKKVLEATGLAPMRVKA